MDTILNVAIDSIKGRIADFSAEQSSEGIRKALIELNNGSTKLNPKTFHRGNELFAIVEELLPVMIEEGFKTDNPLFNLVDYRNIAAGDEAKFYTEGEARFVVADTASGIRDVRRQRIVGGQEVTINPTMKIVRVYENLGRLLAGRIDFNKFVDGVQKAYVNYMNQAAYDEIAAISASTMGLSATYVKSGSYAAATLEGIIDHVEAATGKKAMIVGTRPALAKINTSFTAPSALEDIYNLGYYGQFEGTPMLKLNQVHTPGTDTFALAQDTVWVIAGDDKPIKVVNQGEGMLIEKDATTNADLTQEYIYAQAVGTGVICSEKMGMFTMS